MPVTLRDIALRLGVHPSTVSRALRDDPCLSPEQCQRVHEAARELGYRPDPLLSSMGAMRAKRAGRPAATQAIAWLADSRVEVRSEDRKVAVRERAKELGFDVAEEMDLARFDQPFEASRILYHRGVRGLVIMPEARQRPLRDIEWERFAAVSCGPSVVPHGGHMVTYDAFLQARLAWELGVRAGCRRIGLALLDVGDTITNAQMTGAILHGQRGLAGCNVVPPLLARNPGRAEIGRWMREHRPDLVIGMHEGVYWVMNDAGWSIPGDVRFIALHLTRRNSKPLIAGFSSLHKELGRSAVDMLARLLRAGERGQPSHPVLTVVRPIWLGGDSFGGVTSEDVERLALEEGFLAPKRG